MNTSWQTFWQTRMDLLEKSNPGWIPIAAAIRQVASGDVDSVSLTLDSSLIGSSDQRGILKQHLSMLDPALRITTRIVLSKKGRRWTGKVNIARKK